MRKIAFKLLFMGMLISAQIGTAQAQFVPFAFWGGTTEDPCATSPEAGDVCADGSVYVGMSPDGPNQMFATRCDYGMSWNGSACTGTRGMQTWNGGSTTYDIPSIANCSTASLCDVTGRANSAAIAAVTDPAQGGPHVAAAYCEGLSSNGKTDWYLPSLPELNVLYTNRAAGGLSGTFYTTSNSYWSASESSASNAWSQTWNSGGNVNGTKPVGRPVRCVRRATDQPSSDYAPDAFGFIDVTGQVTGTLINANTVTITGIGPLPVGVSVSGGGSPQIRINGGSWVTSGSISNGQTLQLRLTSSAAPETMLSATVTVGTAFDQWDVTTQLPDPCATSPDVGDVCADGSVYAGMSPDGPNQMFATRCDYGMTWDGSACAGTSGTLKWNNGTTNYNIPSVANCSVANSCDALGRTNSAAIAAVTDPALGGPHQAAEYCENLEESGKSDWYLPSLPETNVLYTNKAVGGMASTFGSGYYWTSTEVSSSTAWGQRFSSGSQESNGYKINGRSVRCVRR